MKQPKPMPVIVLLLAAFAMAACMVAVEGRFRKAVETPASIPLHTEDEFLAALRMERAVLFLHNRNSVESIFSQRGVEAWFREDRPHFPVFIAEPYSQPYIDCWMVERGMEERHGYYARHGMVVWLRLGVIAAELPNPSRVPVVWVRRGVPSYEPPDPVRQASILLGLYTEKAFRQGKR